MLLKHVAVWSQVCLPAMQHVIAAQNKSESVEMEKIVWKIITFFPLL